MTLVSTEWLNNNLSRVKIFDASWHLPNSKRDAKKEYLEKHIPGAMFWDVDEHSDKNSSYPHMIPDSKYWTKMLLSFGITNHDHIVVYDHSHLYSACRLWFVLRYFGHKNVKVVDGGLNAWLAENKPLTSKIPRPERSEFHSEIDTAQVCDINELKSLVGTGAQIWDTRSDEEWNGTESRGNARVGRIPGSIHFEWRHLLEGPPFRRFRPLSEIRTTLVEAGIDVDAPVVSYCQAGIRGAFGQFVLALLGNMESRNYDGSMDEWANEEDTPLEV